MRIKYTQTEIEEIINLFKKYNSYKKVSEYYDISLPSCKSLLNRNGYFVGNRKLKLNKTEADNLIKKSKELLNKELYSFNNLCRELNINPTTFKNYLIKNNIKEIIEKCSSSNKRKNVLSYEIKDKIIELEKQGKGNDAIGKTLGINGSTVRYFLIEHYGIEKYKKRHSVDKFYTPFHSGFINNRGDRFHSSLEMLVADYLYDNNIKYITQDYIKFSNGKFIYPDLYLMDYNLYIEIFGMSEVSFYIPGMEEKIKLYNDNNIPFIGLYYENFKKNDWKKIINKKLNI